MDALSSLLADVRADGAVFGRNVLDPPWSLRFEDGAALAIVIMLRGRGAIDADDGTSIRLHEGDSAIVSRGTSFTLSDGSGWPGSPRYIVHGPGDCTTHDGRPLAEDFSLATRTCGDALTAPTMVLTGSYRVVGWTSQRLLTSLPTVLVVPDEGEICPLMDLTIAELDRDKPGQQAILDRILDLLLLSTLREWLERLDGAAPAWYRALGDPVVGNALRALHERPAWAWTVPQLADTAGVSRATLARRFSDLLGESPMAYLTSWRLSVAADLLQRSDLTVDAVARHVGYQSGFGLSVAFKRVFGLRPTDVRRARAA